MSYQSFTYGTVLGLLLGYGGITVQSTNKNKSYIKNNPSVSPAKLQEISKNIAARISDTYLLEEPILWQKAADSVNAASKAEGIAKKAYFEGQQAIRDSLKHL